MKPILYISLILSIALGFAGVAWEPVRASEHYYDSKRLGNLCASQSLVQQGFRDE